MDIVLFGTIKDTGRKTNSNILKIIRELEKIGIVNTYVVESDSRDKTPIYLERLSKSKKNFNYASLGNLSTKIPSRIERLRFCRNEYVKYFQRIYAEKYPDIVIVADFDGINNKLKSSQIKESVEMPIDWDILCANQKFAYYDILSLRHKYWSPNNFYDDFLWRKQFGNTRRSYEVSLYSKMLKIQTNKSPFEVDSAFGGFAIYKPWIFAKHTYDRFVDKSENEHVSLNLRVKRDGGKIFIVPSLVNNHFNEHNLRKVWIIRMWHFSKKLINLSSRKVY